MGLIADGDEPLDFNNKLPTRNRQGHSRFRQDSPRNHRQIAIHASSPHASSVYMVGDLISSDLSVCILRVLKIRKLKHLKNLFLCSFFHVKICDCLIPKHTHWTCTLTHSPTHPLTHSQFGPRKHFCVIRHCTDIEGIAMAHIRIGGLCSGRVKVVPESMVKS